MNYEVNPMVQNELREKIKEKADAAVKRGDVKTLCTINKNMFSLE